MHSIETLFGRLMKSDKRGRRQSHGTLAVNPHLQERRKVKIKRTLLIMLAGIIIFLAGAILHDVYSIREIGNVLAYSGLFTTSLFAFISIIIFFKQKHYYIFFKQKHYYKPLSRLIENKIKERNKNKAEKQLLRYRELYDKEILTKEEFESKVAELKGRIL